VGNERRTSSWDIQNAPKNYFSLVLAQGGSALFSFAAVWLITRSLGSEGYGGIVAIIAASQIVQVLVNWTAMAVVRYGVDEFIESATIARIFWTRLIILIPNVLLVLLAYPLWFSPLADWLKLSPEMLWFIILHFAGSTLWVHVQFGLQAIKMPRLAGWLLMLERAIIFTALGALFVTGRLSTTWAVICYCTVPLLMMVAGLWFLRKFIFVSFSVDRAFRRKIIAFSLPLLPFSLIAFLSGGYVDAIFISEFLSTRDLGVYAVAGQFNGIILQLPTLANSLLLPLFITVEKEERSQKTQLFFHDLLPALTLSWGIFCTVIAFIGHFIIPLALGGEFGRVVPPFWILLVATSCGFPAFLGYSALSHAASTTYISMYAGILAAIANITFNFLLIPAYGMKGCAWATAICYFVSALTYAFLLKRINKIVLSWTFPAMLPAIVGALCYSETENAWWSFFSSVGVTIILALWHVRSIREAKKYIIQLAGVEILSQNIRRFFRFS
jgi:O-antigen/teichoic acid export membrane protein